MTDEHAAPTPARALRRGWSRLPVWLTALLALVAIGLGLVLLIRPTTSLGVLALLIGAGLIVAGGLELAARRARINAVLAVAWIVAGIAVLAAPGLTVRLLAYVIGIALIARGVVGVVAALRPSALARTLDGRIASGLLGAASILFGATALAWPDITLLIAGVVFGAVLAWTGAGMLLALVRGRRGGSDAASDPPSTARRWLRTTGAVAVVALAVATAGVSVALGEGSRVTDPFYAAPRIVADEPGTLLRAEEFTRGVPPGAQGWRILYTTTHGDGSAAVASGLVVVPASDASEAAPPVIAWHHGTTGFDEACAPTLAAAPFESGALFVAGDVIAEGWALVMTDYIGLGTTGPHPYLVGEDSARAELDAVRAARQLEGVVLADETVAWGHSQGGGAALWTGAIAEAYAPDVPLAGVAALAPASDLIGLVRGLDDVPGGSVFASYVLAGYAGAYADVRYGDYLRPGAEVTVRQMATRCLAAPGMLVSVLTLLALSEDPDVLAADPASGALGQRLRENVPPATTTVPVLLGQGEADSLIARDMQDDFAAAQCAAGVPVDYRTYPGLDHIPLVERGSAAIAELWAWTRQAFAGETPVVACP